MAAPQVSRSGQPPHWREPMAPPRTWSGVGEFSVALVDSGLESTDLGAGRIQRRVQHSIERCTHRCRREPMPFPRSRKAATLVTPRTDSLSCLRTGSHFQRDQQMRELIEADELAAVRAENQGGEALEMRLIKLQQHMLEADQARDLSYNRVWVPRPFIASAAAAIGTRPRVSVRSQKSTVFGSNRRPIRVRRGRRRVCRRQTIRTRPVACRTRSRYRHARAVDAATRNARPRQDRNGLKQSGAPCINLFAIRCQFLRSLEVMALACRLILHQMRVST
jgi:hypothetical protein